MMQPNDPAPTDDTGSDIDERLEHIAKIAWDALPKLKLLTLVAKNGLASVA